jgi:hypothetical protein
MSNNIDDIIDGVFKEKTYVLEVAGEIKEYDKPDKARKVYDKYIVMYADFLKERNSSFKKVNPAVIQAPIINILKATRKYAVLDSRLLVLIEGMEGACHGKAGSPVNRGPKEDADNAGYESQPEEQ